MIDTEILTESWSCSYRN